MATSASNSLSRQLQEYFDQLAPKWDEEIAGQEGLACLRNIIEELDIKPGTYVLDIGSGTGVLLPFLTRVVGVEGRIVAVDLSKKMLLRAKAKGFPAIVDYIQMDALAIPLFDDCVDLAMCNSAFPHFDDKAGTLREIARVLKTGGKLVVCHTAGRDVINQLHQSIGGVVADDLLPKEAQLRDLIKQAGLKISCFEDSPERYLVIAGKIA